MDPLDEHNAVAGQYRASSERWSWRNGPLLHGPVRRAGQQANGPAMPRNGERPLRVRMNLGQRPPRGPVMRASERASIPTAIQPKFEGLAGEDEDDELDVMPTLRAAVVERARRTKQLWCTVGSQHAPAVQGPIYSLGPADYTALGLRRADPLRRSWSSLQLRASVDEVKNTVTELAVVEQASAVVSSSPEGVEMEENASESVVAGDSVVAGQRSSQATENDTVGEQTSGEDDEVVVSGVSAENTNAEGAQASVGLDGSRASSTTESDSPVVTMYFERGPARKRPRI